MLEKAKWEKVGYIDVDAGLCYIGDPCYVLGDDATSKFKEWSDFCLLTEVSKDKNVMTLGHDKKVNEEGLCVCVSTGYGDGSYPVYVKREKGRIKEVRIKFF